MTTEAHLAAGWVLANLSGEDSRRWRAWVTFAAVAPDLDALSYVFGEHVYADIHHALGHNVFVSVVLSIAGMLVYRARPWKAALMTQVAFYSHYFGDYFFTRFPLLFFWPVWDEGFVYSYRIGLDHPINLTLSYGSFALFLAGVWIWRRTPVELIWPELDRRIVNLLSRKNAHCHACGRGSNETCCVCGRNICMHHAKLTGGMRVVCRRCPPAGEAVSDGEVTPVPAAAGGG